MGRVMSDEYFDDDEVRDVYYDKASSRALPPGKGILPTPLHSVTAF